MENRAELCKAINLIAWGYIFLYFNINVGIVNIMPAWVGFIFFIIAINKTICKEEPSAKLLQPLGIFLAVYNGIIWVLSILELSYNTSLIGTLATVISMYFHFQLLTNVAAIAEKCEYPEKKKLLTLRTVLIILETVLMFSETFVEEYYTVVVVIAIVEVVIAVWICIVLFNFKKYFRKTENQSIV